MDDPGVIKAIDKLGRLVIPIEMRERYNLNEYVEITTTENGILVRNPKYKLVEINDSENDTINK